MDKDDFPSKNKSESRKDGSGYTQSDCAGGRVDSKHRAGILRTSSAKVPTREPMEKKRSAKRRNEMLVQGLCFTCGQQGHLARNCRTTTNMKSDVKGKPPGFGAHGVHFSTADSALLDSTEVLDTLPIGAMHFAIELPMDFKIPAVL
jgi:hypothetical protein